MTDAGHRERRDEDAGRVAFLACTGSTSELRGGQGPLDSDAVRERLAQPDAGFSVRDLDARDDLAAQIEEALAAFPEPPSTVLLYVSARAMRADGELLLLLDPEHPDTGDALGDIIGALREGTTGEVLTLLELRVSPGMDELEPMEIARLGRLTARETAVEVVVAVQRHTETDEINAESCSPFTKALLEALDAADPRVGATASEVYESAREHPGVLGVVAALAHAGPEASFALLPATEAEEARPVDTEEEPPPDEQTAPEDSPEPPRVEPSPEPPIVTKPEPAKPEPAKSEPPKPVSLPPPPLSQSAPPPPTAGQLIDEADELARDGRDEDALARYRKALAVAATTDGSDSDRAHIYVRIGEVKLRQGKARESIASFEKGLALDPKLPGSGNVLKSLLGLYFGERDHRGAYAIQQKLLGQIADPADITAALVVFARSWLDDVGDLLRAREALEQAAALSPADVAVVRLLLELATREGRTEDALALRKRVADLETNDRARANQLLTLAKELITKHKREDEALDVLEAALEAEPSELEPLALLSELLGERQEWSELEGAYRRMLDRVPRIEDDSLRSMLENEIGRRLGLLLEDHLEDPRGALDAFEVAARARPRETIVRRKAAVLAQSVGDAERAIEHLLALTAVDPSDVAANHALFDLLMRTDNVERAAEVAAVLSHLRAASDKERAVLAANTMGERPKGTLSDEDWALLRFDLDPEGADPSIELVAAILGAASSATAGALADVAKRAGRLPALDDGQLVDPETSTVSAARCLAWASKAASVALPRVYLDDATSVAMTPVLRELPATVVGSGALRGKSLQELSFLAGHHLASQRAEHRIAKLSAELDDVAACFVTAVLVAVPDTPVPEHLRALVDLLLPRVRERISPEDEALLDEAVLAFDAEGARADIGAYIRAADRAGLRAGLLLAGNLSVALAMAKTLPGGPDMVRQRESELCSFNVSNSAAELRARLGWYD